MAHYSSIHTTSTFINCSIIKKTDENRNGYDKHWRIFLHVFTKLIECLRTNKIKIETLLWNRKLYGMHDGLAGMHDECTAFYLYIVTAAVWVEFYYLNRTVMCSRWLAFIRVIFSHFSLSFSTIYCQKRLFPTILIQSAYSKTKTAYDTLHRLLSTQH